MESKYKIYPVYREIPADIETPVSAFYALKEEGKKGFLLESVEMGEWIARYSFIGFEPELEITAKKNQVRVSFKGKQEEFESADPTEEVRKIAASFQEAKVEGMPPFTAGLVGYFGYDTVRYFERLPDVKPDRMGLPDIYLMMPKVLIAFDHILQKMILMTFSYDKENKKAEEDLLKKYEEKLYHSRRPPRIQNVKDGPLRMISNMKREAYQAMVEKAKHCIFAGDIFQVVLSQKFRMETQTPPFEIYRKLRMINPSPYMFFIDFGDFRLIGSSPEVMVKRIKSADKDEIIVRPIAGTRKRGKTSEEDLATEKELLRDKKELAEHTMLLDLARNDIGRISEYGSVRVERPFHIERYSHVMHIVSDVIGKAREGTNPVGVIAATFPAGTVSGSPKVRAMEIIEELEPEKRGVYAGAVGYIDFHGNTDTCIAIRTLVHKDNTVYLQAGAGIVYDSDPAKEYEETLNKARALFKALV